MLRTRRVVCAILAAMMVTACGKDDSSPTSATSGSASAPVEAQVRWNVASAFPTNLSLIGESAPIVSKKISEASGGTLELKMHEPGALVPSLEAIQAAGKGSVDAAWSTAGFFAGTDSAFSFFTAVPFGPTIPEFMAWMYQGGGLELQNEMLGRHGIHAIPCVVIPPEASGWFRREITTLEDLKGLKMRFFGLGAKVMEKLGVSTQLLAPGDIFQAMQLGTIDATEFAMPTIDEKLGFHQVAKYYYFPGWHQSASFLNLFINKNRWDALSPRHKAVLEQACGDTMRQMIAQGEATQWAAMQRMRDDKGVQLRQWSPQMLQAFRTAWESVVQEESQSNASFKAVYESYSAFRKNYSLWRDFGYVKD